MGINTLLAQFELCTRHGRVYNPAMPQSVSTSEDKKTPWGSFTSLVIIQSMNSLNEKGVQFLLI